MGNWAVTAEGPTWAILRRVNPIVRKGQDCVFACSHGWGYTQAKIERVSHGVAVVSYKVAGSGGIADVTTYVNRCDWGSHILPFSPDAPRYASRVSVSA